MRYRVGIDIGGTFTDFALLKGGEVILHKNLSTSEDRSIGVMSGLEKLAQIEGLHVSDFLGQCDAIVHGTTIADNTLIEMNGALTGLITTAGFRDEMEYRRGYKEDIWDLRLPPPVQITPRRRRLTVSGRILFDGTEYEPLDEAGVREACRKLKKQKVESVAISLIFSIFHLNPSPVCLLDEVDAPLDDSNVVRFASLIREMSEGVQFLVITHNKLTMEMADQLMGVTMNEPGVSRLVSVDVEEAAEMAAV